MEKSILCPENHSGICRALEKKQTLRPGAKLFDPEYLLLDALKSVPKVKMTRTQILKQLVNVWLINLCQDSKYSFMASIFQSFGFFLDY